MVRFFLCDASITKHLREVVVYNLKLIGDLFGSSKKMIYLCLYFVNTCMLQSRLKLNYILFINF